MKRVFFTITGMYFRYNSEFLERGMQVGLVKEPDNAYDAEAIRVVLSGLDTIGYVANSPKTVIGNCYSAGRLYDLIGDTATGIVLYVLDGGAVCMLDSRDSGFIEDEIAGKFRIDGLSSDDDEEDSCDDETAYHPDELQEAPKKRSGRCKGGKNNLSGSSLPSFPDIDPGDFPFML